MGHRIQQRRALAAVFAISALMLCACGKAGEQSVEADAPTAANANANANANAGERYFDPLLGRPNCPARVSAASYAGADILDVKLGMTRDEGLAVLFCQRRNFSVRTDDGLHSSGAPRADLGPQGFTVLDAQRQPCSFDESDFMDRHLTGARPCRAGEFEWTGGLEEIHVEAPGLGDDKRVLGVWRMQRFPDGEAPPADDLIATLIRKYGEPLFREGDLLRWAWDASGQPLAIANPLARECAANLNPVYSGGQSWSDACGQTIAVLVGRVPDNRAIADQFNVAIFNQSAFYRVSEQLEQAAIAEAARQSQDQVNRARANARDLDL